MTSGSHTDGKEDLWSKVRGAGRVILQFSNYSYNYLDKLTEVNQGGQYRKFKYDAIGRLLFEKIPEQTATINDGTGTYWTTKYSYTTFDAVATKTDARGVITSFAYDGLNRLSQVSYNTVSGVTTAPTVSYVYDSDPTYGTTADGNLVRVNVGSDYQGAVHVRPAFQGVKHDSHDREQDLHDQLLAESGGADDAVDLSVKSRPGGEPRQRGSAERNRGTAARTKQQRAELFAERDLQQRGPGDG